MHEDARGDEFMILLEGQAVVTQGGRQIATLGRGDLVGEMALLQDQGRGRRNATVTALTDIVLYAGSPASSAGFSRPRPPSPRKCARRPRPG